MAGIREMAIGIATTLQVAKEPEPLPAVLQGMSLEDAGQLIYHIAQECRDAGIPLARVVVDPELFAQLGAVPTLAGAIIEPATDQWGSVRLYRRPATSLGQAE